MKLPKFLIRIARFLKLVPPPKKELYIPPVTTFFSQELLKQLMNRSLFQLPNNEPENTVICLDKKLPILVVPEESIPKDVLNVTYGTVYYKQPLMLPLKRLTEEEEFAIIREMQDRYFPRPGTFENNR